MSVIGFCAWKSLKNPKLISFLKKISTRPFEGVDRGSLRKPVELIAVVHDHFYFLFSIELKNIRFSC